MGSAAALAALGLAVGNGGFDPALLLKRCVCAPARQAARQRSRLASHVPGVARKPPCCLPARVRCCGAVGVRSLTRFWRANSKKKGKEPLDDDNGEAERDIGAVAAAAAAGEDENEQAEGAIFSTYTPKHVTVRPRGGGRA